eukprot:4197939-Prymnesium_polylepis.1
MSHDPSTIHETVARCKLARISSRTPLTSAAPLRPPLLRKDNLDKLEGLRAPHVTIETRECHVWLCIVLLLRCTTSTASEREAAGLAACWRKAVERRPLRTLTFGARRKTKREKRKSKRVTVQTRPTVVL